MNWTTINRMRVPEERKARRACKKALAEQLAPVIKAVRDATTFEALSASRRVQVPPEPMERVIIDTSTRVAPRFAMYTRRALKDQKSDDPALDAFLARTRTATIATAGKRITAINDFTQSEVERIIGGVLDEAFDGGWSTIDAIDAITGRFRQMTFTRAERIARTEVLTASNMGSLMGAESLGVPFRKKWIATSDSRTRDSHKALNGKLAGDNGRFSNGLEYPGDPNGDPSEVVNCRCAIGYDVEKQGGYSNTLGPVSDPSQNVFIPAATLEEAKQFTRDVIGIKSDIADLNLDARNEVNKNLHRLTREYKSELYELGTTKKAGVYASANNDTLNCNLSYFNNLGKFKKQYESDEASRWHPFKSSQDPVKSIMDHEFAHVLTSRDLYLWQRRAHGSDLANELMYVRNDYVHWLSVNKKVLGENLIQHPDFISVYANKDAHEFVAEAFSGYLNGNQSNPWCKKVFDIINKYRKA